MVTEWGRVTKRIQKYRKTGINITIFFHYSAFFKVKKSIVHRNQWLTLRDLIYQGKNLTKEKSVRAHFGKNH